MSFDCFNRIDKKSTSRRRSCDDEKNSQNRFFRCESKSLKSFRFFSTDRVIWNVFCRRNRSESKSKWTRRTHIQFIAFFNDSCESDSFSSFFDCWNKSHRDRVALNSFRVRSELLLMMFACRSVVVRFIHASARSKWIMHSRSLKIVAQLARYWSAFFTNDVRHVCDLHAISDLSLQLIQMQIDESDVRFNFQNRNRNDSKEFENAS